MATIRLSLIAAATWGALALVAPSQAAPLTGTLDAKSAVPSSITDVQFRRAYPRFSVAPRYIAPRRYGYAPYRAYPRGRSYWPFIGFGSAIVAGAIIANNVYAPRRGSYYDTYAYDGPYYYPSDYRGDPRTICARHFRSFEWDTGLYTAYSGEKRMCPYLGE